MGKIQMIGMFLVLLCFANSAFSQEIVHVAEGVTLFGPGGEKHPRSGKILGRLRVVSEGGWVELKLRPQLRLWILKESEVEIEPGKINLLNGKALIHCADSCDYTLTTPLTSEAVTIGNYLIEYYPLVPKVVVAVEKGESVLRGLESDQGKLLKANEAAEFEGRFEFGEIAYDILLKGKKSARGLLSAARSVSDQEKLLFKPPVAPVFKQRKSTENKSDVICKTPSGKLNQCLWSCEGIKKGQKECNVKLHSCVRSRCNANGKWADSVKLEPTRWKCKANLLVAECDY